jgi:hypothetical protein
MLRQHIQPTRAQRRGVLRAFGQRGNGRPALHDLEPVGRHQHRAGGLIHAVVGAADPLGQTAGPLGRAHIDHQIHIAPVDPQIERRGADHRAQTPSRHGGFDLAPLA